MNFKVPLFLCIVFLNAHHFNATNEDGVLPDQSLGLFLKKICALTPANAHHGNMLCALLNCAAYCEPVCTPHLLKKMKNDDLLSFFLWQEHHKAGIWNMKVNNIPYWPVVHHVNALTGLTFKQKQQQSFALVQRMILLALKRMR